MPAGKRGGAGASPFSHKKEGTASPRRREALKRFVSLVKRKGGGKRGGGGVTFAAGFRLLHVDVFQASGLVVLPLFFFFRIVFFFAGRGCFEVHRVEHGFSCQPCLTARRMATVVLVHHGFFCCSCFCWVCAFLPFFPDRSVGASNLKPSKVSNVSARVCRRSR